MHMSECARTTLKISSSELVGRMAEGRRLVIRRYQKEQNKKEQLGHHKKEQERHKKEQVHHKKEQEHHKKEQVLHKRQLVLRRS